MLSEWGWDEGWADLLSEHGPEGGRPARVVGQERDRWAICMEQDFGQARISSGVRVAHPPVVGDWIVVESGPMPSDPWSVASVLPRRSAISRGAAGTGTVEHVLAANVDVVWIVHGLDLPVNARRLERSLAIAWESGALPEIILTKADLASDLPSAVAEAQAHAVVVPVRSVSTGDEASVTRLRGSLRPAQTVVLLGPSGVGKSTLVNALGDAALAGTGAVRERDHKGRHTTTRRELYRIPGGALLLDTPGIRELRVWALGDGLDRTFPEIHDLAQRCRFGDCRHDGEPGCAVLAAEAAGEVEPERMASFRKLQAEAAYQARKTDHRAQQAALSERKAAMKTLKYHPKHKRQE